VGDVGRGGDVRCGAIADEELFPGGRVVEAGEQIIKDSSSELGRLFEWDVSQCCARRICVQQTYERESREEGITDIELVPRLQVRDHRQYTPALQDARS
jgi:hypothetical protein